MDPYGFGFDETFRTGYGHGWDPVYNHESEKGKARVKDLNFKKVPTSSLEVRELSPIEDYLKNNKSSAYNPCLKTKPPIYTGNHLL